MVRGAETAEQMAAYVHDAERRQAAEIDQHQQVEANDRLRRHSG